VDLYNLGPVTWWESQCFYHAMAALGREGLIICYPTTPYVCLGLHDDLDQEIDQEYCRVRGLPLLRRETGGGVVYLDSCQLFFQLVLHRDNPLLPLRRLQFFEKFLRPAIAGYRSFGLPAELRAPADIVADGRKCSGAAAGDIGPCVAYVGNLLLDFDFYTMSKVLRVPTAIYRRCLYQAMRRNMTTLADWMTKAPEYSELAMALVNEFARHLSDLSPRTLDRELVEMSIGYREKLTAMAWLSLPGRKQARRRVKIAEGVHLLERNLGGLESIVVLIREGMAEEPLHMGGPGIDSGSFQFTIGTKEEKIFEVPQQFNP